MARVRDALLAYEQAVAAQGFDLFSVLRRGQPRAEVVEQLEAAGVEPIDDIVDWFAFSDGRLPSSPGEPSLSGVFDEVSAVSLEMALDERAERLDPDFFVKQYGADQLRELTEANLIVPFRASWMPISVDKLTCVIETDRRSKDIGQLIALWNDELEPRNVAADLAAWLDALTAAVPSGSISQRTARDAAPAGTGILDLGAIEMTKEDKRRLSRLRDSTFLQEHCDGIRLLYARPGSLANNNGLEEQQVEVVEQCLRENGFEHMRFERVAADPRSDRVHAVKILGILKRPA